MSGAAAKASPNRAIQSVAVDPKPSELPMGRLKRGEDPVEDRTDLG